MHKLLFFIGLAYVVSACSGGSDPTPPTTDAAVATVDGATQTEASTPDAPSGSGDSPSTPVPTGCILHDRTASAARCSVHPFSFECPTDKLPGDLCMEIGQAPTGYYFFCCE